MGPRARRFLTEFIIATVVTELISTWLAGLWRPSNSYSSSPLFWVPAIATAIAQGLVLRRYVPWAHWWALAAIAGEGLSRVLPLSTLVNFGHDSLGLSAQAGVTVFTVTTALVTALLQLPTLAGRVFRPGLWLLALPAAELAARAATTLLPARVPGPTATTQLLVFVAIRNIPIAIITGLVLARMCRSWLTDDETPPAARPHSRLEFLIAWIAVPPIAFDVIVAVETGTGSPELIRVVPLAFLLVLAAGQLWVIAGTGLDFRRWRVATLSAAVGFGVLAFLDPIFLPVFVYHYGLLLTKGTALALPLALGQLFALGSLASRMAWIPASLIAWWSGMWLPQLIHNLVGPANTWRYPVTHELLGILAGVVTGLVLLLEPGLIRQPAPTNRIS